VPSLRNPALLFLLLVTSCGASEADGALADASSERADVVVIEDTQASAPDRAAAVLSCTNPGSPTINGLGCGFLVALSGPLTGGLTPNACGHSQTILEFQSFEGVGRATTVSLAFSTPLGASTLGPTALAGVTILRTENGMTSEWRTSPGGCTVTILSNTFSPTDMDGNRRLITGTGCCTASAEPTGGNAQASIAIGGFAFQGFIDQ